MHDAILRAVESADPAGAAGPEAAEGDMGNTDTAILLTEDFDDGTANGWVTSGLWHVSSCRSASAPKAMAYNKDQCPTDYHTGSRTEGGAVTPSVVVPATATSVRVTWKGWHQTEGGPSYDKKTLWLTTNGGSSWKQLYQETGLQTQWLTRTLELSDLAGKTIKLRFYFDSIDGLYNMYEGWYIDDVQVTAEVPVEPPSPPRNLAAEPDVGAIHLAWDEPVSDGGAPVTYTVFRSTSFSGPPMTTASGLTTRAYTHQGLPDGQTYWYHVVAVNSAGESDPSNIVKATTIAKPGAPQDLVASPGEMDASVRLEWTAPEGGAHARPTSYSLYRDNGSGYELVAELGAAQTSHVDADLSPLGVYRYVVTASNAAGTGPASDEACVQAGPSAGVDHGSPACSLPSLPSGPASGAGRDG